MRSSRLLQISVLLFASPAWFPFGPVLAQDTSPTSGSRTWTAADGRTLEAQLVGDMGWRVVLERNGTAMTIPLTSLSLPDREWLDARWLTRKSTFIGADPLSSTTASGDSSEAIRLAEQIRDLGFAHPVWRTLAAAVGPSGGSPSPALRLQIRKARFSSSSGYPGTPPPNAVVYYVLLNSSEAGGTIAYADVVWDEDKDLFSSTPSLAQMLTEKIEAEKYTALALAGEYDALKHYAVRILDSTKAMASMNEQRACLLALGDGRCVDTMDLARICVEKLSMPELCLEAARALGLSRGIEAKPVIARLEALREQLKRNEFHSKSAQARQVGVPNWTRLGIKNHTDFHQVVEIAIQRLNPSRILGRLDRQVEYDERLELLAILRPYMLDEIRRTGAGSEDAEDWTSNLMRQCDPLALRLVLDSLEACEDDKEFRRLVEHVGSFKRPAGYQHSGISLVPGCDANPFPPRKWTGSESPSIERFFRARDGSNRKLVPLPLHERAVELLVKSLPVHYGALGVLESLEETALNALPGLSVYLQELQKQERSTHTRETVLETIGAIATAARSRAMDLPPLPGLAEAVARELSEAVANEVRQDSTIVREACAVLKPLGKQASTVVPQLQALARTPAGQKIAAQLNDAIASIQIDEAAAAVSN